MKKISVLLITLWSGFLAAADVSPSQLTSVEIVDDRVIFSLHTAKSHPIASCAANSASTKESWTFSLGAPSGRAMYSLLMTAVAKQQKVQVTTANTCLQQIEVASGVRLAVTQAPVSSGGSDSGKVYLYKGDGVTKVGTVIDSNAPGRTVGESGGMPNTGVIRYVPIEDPTLVRDYALTHFNESSIMFTDPQCQNEAYYHIHDAQKQNAYYTGVNSFMIANSNINGFFQANLNLKMSDFGTTKKGYFINHGRCTLQHNSVVHYTSYYKLEPAIHPVCGASLCQIK